MAAYPSSLPAPLARAYKLEPVDQTVRTDMEMGAAKVRRRTAARNDHIGLAFQFSDAGMASFRSWFDNATTGADGGAAWFTIDIRTGDGGLVNHEARFVGPFRADYLAADQWAVSATVEVR